jgi:hypothetical protein
MNAPSPLFLRRLGPARACEKTEACPDLLELSNGDFAVIGTDITAESAGKLPPGSGCAAHERIIVIPRRLIIDAKADIAAVE